MSVCRKQLVVELQYSSCQKENWTQKVRWFAQVCIVSEWQNHDFSPDPLISNLCLFPFYQLVCEINLYMKIYILMIIQVSLQNTVV